MTVRILLGDCREVLQTLPDESVHCVVTSPPYWGLRDYGMDGQLGLEPTYQEHVDIMVNVFREVRRVLRADGTLWLNYGDSYATSVNGRSAADTKAVGNDDRTFRDKPFSTIQGILKPKDLCGIPWRVAFALQADGWYLRQDIIWSKPNPMPESVRDRCTKAHEYLFLLSKSERYYYDIDAIKEDAVGGVGGTPKKVHDEGAQGRHGATLALNEPWPGSTTRNRRSVWEITSQPFADAHFATFPPALIEPCILAGCPKGGTVLDPFAGAGTTGLVADRLQRNAILIELNPAYAAMSERRIENDAPLFAEILVGNSPRPNFDPVADFAGSLDEAYRAIRARMAAGGPRMDPKMIGRKERILVVEELWRDNERLRSLLADVIRYWELRDPNRGAAFETVIRRVKNALKAPSPFGGPGWTPKEPK